MGFIPIKRRNYEGTERFQTDLEAGENGLDFNQASSSCDIGWE